MLKFASTMLDRPDIVRSNIKSKVVFCSNCGGCTDFFYTPYRCAHCDADLPDVMDLRDREEYPIGFGPTVELGPGPLVRRKTYHFTGKVGRWKE